MRFYKKTVALVAALMLTTGLSLIAFVAEPDEITPQGVSEGPAWQTPF